MESTIRALVFGSIFSLFFATPGCSGGSGQPEVVSDQSELEKWVSENPSPEPADPSAIEGS